MSARVRLRRIGKNPKGNPHFRISVMDQHTGRDGRVIEEIGFYNPVSKETRIDLERYNHWAKNGAEITVSVKNIAKKASKAKA
jgi:small subunit ribosomal protein S16